MVVLMMCFMLCSNPQGRGLPRVEPGVMESVAEFVRQSGGDKPITRSMPIANK